MTSENDWVVNNIYGVNTIVNGDYWGAKDINGINGFGVSFGVGN